MLKIGSFSFKPRAWATSPLAPTAFKRSSARTMRTPNSDSYMLYMEPLFSSTRLPFKPLKGAAGTMM